MINRLNIYDEHGKKIGEVRDAARDDYDKGSMAGWQ
jgi:sporulation protein YlmC with PRC-barrel domain